MLDKRDSGDSKGNIWYLNGKYVASHSFNKSIYMQICNQVSIYVFENQLNAQQHPYLDEVIIYVCINQVSIHGMSEFLHPICVNSHINQVHTVYLLLVNILKTCLYQCLNGVTVYTQINQVFACDHT